MNKPKPDEQSSVVQPLAAKLEQPPKLPGLPQTFRDKVFTSRTLITPQGQSLTVARGQVIAITPDQYQFLQTHPDLEPAPE
jgi:hypothetical protein